LEGDKLFQALGAKGLVEGRGITFQHVLASDLTTRLNDPVNRWPIAYSVLLAPFYWLTNNMEVTCIIVDLLSIFFFFFALYRLLHRLQLQSFLISAVILFCGTMFGPSISKPTDLLACACLLYTCLLFIAFESDATKPPGFGLAIATSIVMAAAFRYMYAPCLCIIPALLLWIGYSRKDKRIQSGAKYTIVGIVIFYAAFLLFQKVSVGSSVYIIGAEKGFFPANLLRLYPFIPDAFDINFMMQQLESFAHVSFMFFLACLRYINLLLLALLLYKCIALIICRPPVLWTVVESFFVLCTFISSSILLLLSYLSVTNSSAPIPTRIPFAWTFVGDGRYFLFPITILPAVAAWWLFNKQWFTMRKIRQPLRYLFFVLIIFQVVHTLYFLTRRFDPLGLKGDNVLITRRGESYLQRRIKECKQQGYNVVLTGTDETVSNWAELGGNNGILRVSELLSTDVHPKNPSIVFVLVAQHMLPSIKTTLTYKQFLMETQIGPMTVFSKKYARR
jgi:hypothetical protein